MGMLRCTHFHIHTLLEHIHRHIGVSGEILNLGIESLNVGEESLLLLLLHLLHLLIKESNLCANSINPTMGLLG
jgi:hypothetical protein